MHGQDRYLPVPLSSLLPWLALCAMVLVCYFPAIWWGGFVWDDRILLESKAIHQWSGLSKIWLSPSVIRNEVHYWPLTYTTFWLEHKLWGLSPTGYHLVNVLLHLANTLLLWRILLHLKLSGAWLVAAVFAVHPVHVESVAWVIERKDTLSTLCYLGAAWYWIQHVEHPGSQWLRYCLSLLLLTAALLSKSIVVTLPLALLLWHWWIQGKVAPSLLPRLAPFFLITLVITVADLHFYRSMTTVNFDYSLVERLLIAARSLWFYATKLVWPDPLMVIYPHWEVDVGSLLDWACVLATCALPVGLWLARKHIGRGPLTGVLFFGLTLFPVLGFVDHGYMEFSFVADRYQYLASIGLLAVIVNMMVQGAYRLADMHQTASGRDTPSLLAIRLAGLSLLCLLGILSWRQAHIYRDVVTFNSYIISHNPQAHQAHRNLAKGLFDRGNLQAALAAARIAVEQEDSADAYTALGTILHVLERDEAEPYLRSALEREPYDPTALHNLANLLNRQGRDEEALELLRIGVKTDPNHPDHADIHTTLGRILQNMGRFDEARKRLLHAQKLEPQSTYVRQTLGEWFRKQGRYREAMMEYQAVLDIDPETLMAHLALANVLHHLKDYNKAEQHLRTALKIEPKNSQVQIALAKSLIEKKRYPAAIQHLRQVISQTPDPAMLPPEILLLMGIAAKQSGETTVALQHFKQALQLAPESPKTLMELAALQFEQKQYPEALKLLQTVVEIEPENASIHSDMGVVLYALGRTAEALQHFEQALTLDPDLESARNNREQILRQQKH